MTVQIGSHTAVVHGWDDDPLRAVEFAMERVPNLVENGWVVRSVSHAYGPRPDDKAVSLYSAVVTLSRRESYETPAEDSGSDF